jgi:hypothetical protein
MSPDSLGTLLVLMLIALIMISFWRLLLLLILSLVIAASILGLYQIIHFLRL